MLFILLLVLSFPLSYKQAISYLAQGEFKKADSLFKVAIFEAEESEKNDIFLHLELLIVYGKNPDIIKNYGKIESAFLDKDYQRALKEWENTPQDFRKTPPGLYLNAILIEITGDFHANLSIESSIDSQKKFKK